MIDTLGAAPSPIDAADINDERAGNERPVRAVGASWFDLPGGGRLPAFVSPAWESGGAHVTAALILIHGRLRNADAYYAFAEAALRAARRSLDDTVLIVPQFLAQADVAAHRLPADTLHWDWTGWMGGDAGLAPHPRSSFEVLDAIVARCAQPGRFPALSRVVLAGHSGGAQVVHRYAVVAPHRADAPRVATRFVIANPSSYVYFDDRRPDGHGGFGPFERARCADFDRWKYGPRDAPAYVGDTSFDVLEARYVRRDVVYLWGANDCDPRHPALDVSCAAQAQGPQRLARGQAYFRYLQARHGAALAHRGLVVPGVGHDGAAMLSSPEGVAALFGAP